MTLTGVVNWLRWNPDSAPGLAGEQLSADSPTGDAAERAARLQLSRTVRGDGPAPRRGGGGPGVGVDVEVAPARRERRGVRGLPGHVDRVGDAAPNAGTPEGDDLGYPGLRRPGGTESSWRVLVEEHELLDADPTVPGVAAAPVPRLVYADAVAL